MRAIAAALALGLLAAPAFAAPVDMQALTDAFTNACVPQRLSYDGTRRQALAEGWVEVAQTAHPELDVLMKKAVAELEADDTFPDIQFRYQAYRRDVSGRPHYLVVSHFDSGVVEGFDDPFIENGCYLYDFDATGPIDPAPVTAFTGKPIAREQIEDGHMIGYLWGPPCSLPRTGDTYLTLVPDGSKYAAQTGFTGLVLKFSTAEPDPGEVVPDTYC
jgi:hypothetical protein